MVHYNCDCEIIVASDASPYDISTVLSHKLPDESKKPIKFASRTLNESEKKYAQIDKEALALVFSVKYFHQFVYGKEFNLRTDHNSLISIFGEKKGIPLMAAHRLQRYVVFLTGYTHKIEFVKGVDNGNADALSRLPLKLVCVNSKECDKFFINMITTNIKSIGDLNISNAIKKDKTYVMCLLRCLLGNGLINSK